MTKISYAGYRFPPEIIQQAIWLYLRFTLSLRDVEDLLAERGIAASYDTIGHWENRFGPIIATDLRKRRAKPNAVQHLDEGPMPSGLSSDDVFTKKVLDGKFLEGSYKGAAAEEFFRNTYAYDVTFRATVTH
jgi:hypothetical protein